MIDIFTNLCVYSHGVAISSLIIKITTKDIETETKTIHIC